VFWPDGDDMMEKLLTDLERLDLEERQITATMEHEICVAGQFSRDWNEAIGDIRMKRQTIWNDRRRREIEMKEGD